MKGRKKQLDELWAAQRGLCWYCEEPVARELATRDHVHPRSSGGPGTKRNLVMACKPCNVRKGSSATWKKKTAARMAELVAKAEGAPAPSDTPEERDAKRRREEARRAREILKRQAQSALAKAKARGHGTPVSRVREEAYVDRAVGCEHEDRGIITNHE